MGPGRSLRFGLAASSYDWLFTRDGAVGGSSGATTALPPASRGQRREPAGDGLEAEGAAAPPGHPGCTDVGPVVGTIHFADGGVLEWID